MDKVELRHCKSLRSITEGISALAVILQMLVPFNSMNRFYLFGPFPSERDGSFLPNPSNLAGLKARSGRSCQFAN
jgi:hypothetical protein